jgi:hypothetical protein
LRQLGCGPGEPTQFAQGFLNVFVTLHLYVVLHLDDGSLWSLWALWRLNVFQLLKILDLGLRSRSGLRIGLRSRSGLGLRIGLGSGLGSGLGGR